MRYPGVHTSANASIMVDILGDYDAKTTNQTRKQTGVAASVRFKIDRSNLVSTAISALHHRTNPSTGRDKMIGHAAIRPMVYED